MQLLSKALNAQANRDIVALRNLIREMTTCITREFCGRTPGV